MADITSLLESYAFWFSSVLVAILINLLSAYMKTPVDRLLGWLNTTWEARSKERHSTFLKAAFDIAHSKTRMEALAELETHLMLMTILGMLLALHLLVADVMVTTMAPTKPAKVIHVVVYFISLGIVTLGIMTLNKARRAGRQLAQARRFIREGVIEGRVDR